jgi:hypothetical protein
MLWCSHFCRKGQNFVNPSCKIHLLKLPITLKCKNVNQVVKPKKVNSPKYTIVLIDPFNNHDLLWPTWNWTPQKHDANIFLWSNPYLFMCVGQCPLNVDGGYLLLWWEMWNISMKYWNQLCRYLKCDLAN